MNNYSLENNSITTEKKSFGINIKVLIPLLIIIHIFELIYFLGFASHKQPYITNLLGFIGLIYPILLSAHSILHYKKNSYFFQTNLFKKWFFIILASLLSIYFVLTSILFIMSNNKCNLDYFGGCGLMNFAAIVIGLIGSVIYSRLISRIEIKVNNVVIKKYSTPSFVITSLVVLILSSIFITVGIQHIKNKSDRAIEEIRERFEAEREVSILSVIRSTEGNRDLCPEAPEDFFITSGTEQSYATFHFPARFVSGVGYVFVTYENYWNGVWNTGEYDFDSDKKYVTNKYEEYTDFSKTSGTSLNTRGVYAGEIIISKKLKYDVRIAVFEDLEIQNKIKNKELYLYNDYKGTYLARLGQSTKVAPIEFSSVFPGNASCVTVSVK